MSIKSNVDDAIFLFENGRPLGALSNLMIAIAASSRKRFPLKMQQSIVNPVNKKGAVNYMSDNEAFRTFLAERLRIILFNNTTPIPTINSGISLNFKGEDLDLGEILYKHYRCELIHNGDLPSDFLFVDDGDKSTSFGFTDKQFTLSYGWIRTLIDVVVGADVNAAEFGRTVEKFVPKHSEFNEDDLIREVSEKFSFKIMPMTFLSLQSVVQALNPEHIKTSNDVIIIDSFRNVILQELQHNTIYKGINGGTLTGLRFEGICSDNNDLTQYGVDALKFISSYYKIELIQP